MLDLRVQDLLAALEALPSATYVMTSAFDGKRAGVLVRWVQACATEPVLISVSMRRGHHVEPLIRDSRHFGICQVDPEDKLIQRKFADGAKREPDPFDCLAVDTLQSSSPMIKKSPLALDCEILRHFDLEADHSLYIGRVVAARVRPAGHAHGGATTRLNVH